MKTIELVLSGPVSTTFGELASGEVFQDTTTGDIFIKLADPVIYILRTGAVSREISPNAVNIANGRVWTFKGDHHIPLKCVVSKIKLEMNP